MNRRERQEAVLDAATLIETMPERYRFVASEIPVRNFSTRVQGCALAWIGHFMNRTFPRVAGIEDVARMLGCEDETDFYTALNGIAATTSQGHTFPYAWAHDDALATVEVLRAFADTITVGGE